MKNLLELDATYMGLDTIIVDVGDGEVELNLEAAIAIGDDLSQEFADQPSLYAYMAMLAARVEAVWLDSKKEMEREHAQTDKAVRQEMAEYGMKTTEGKVAAEVELREDYIAAVDYELDCREQHLIMRAVTRAMEQRAQMLISLGAHLRAEADQTGMVIRDVKAKLRGTRRNVHIHDDAGHVGGERIEGEERVEFEYGEEHVEADPTANIPF